MSENDGPMSILIVEDAFLVGMQLKEDLESLGYSVVGPANSVQKAISLIERHSINGAVLDVNLGHENSTPIATRLDELRIPFLFITGYETVSVDDKMFSDKTLLRKPILLSDIQNALSNLSLDS